MKKRYENKLSAKGESKLTNQDVESYHLCTRCIKDKISEDYPLNMETNKHFLERTLLLYKVVFVKVDKTESGRFVCLRRQT